MAFDCCTQIDQLHMTHPVYLTVKENETVKKGKHKFDGE